jgi:UDP-N-acetylglucosamine/UDP-N-acetylgalactosamine 4-epimerase
MTVYAACLKDLRSHPKTWLITGVAGFIGSNLLELLLANGQKVRGLDNFSTGTWENLDEVLQRQTRSARGNFELMEGDIQDWDTCLNACRGVELVLHQAALGSVPRSFKQPLASHATNVSGFLNMLLAAHEQKVGRFVYASSSSIYGDLQALPKVEQRTGRPLSPYAATKVINELYADLFSRTFGVETIGLRYFNVFGPRQNPLGPYAAVIPQWVLSMIRNEPAEIYGDGLTSRDFCYVENTVQANVLAATTHNPLAINAVFNVALNARITLNELFELIRGKLLPEYPHLRNYKPVYRPFRAGDIPHSYANINKARRLLCYHPTHTVKMGLDSSLDYYKKCDLVQKRDPVTPGRYDTPRASASYHCYLESGRQGIQ